MHEVGSNLPTMPVTTGVLLTDMLKTKDSIIYLDIYLAYKSSYPHPALKILQQLVAPLQ